VGAELQTLKADAGDPLANQPSILAGCQTAASPAFLPVRRR
jgi:hypothetical protein